MTETVLFETERMSSLSDVASYLRSVADKLDAGEPVTLESGNESVTLDPPETVEFEVKAEHEGPDGDGELSLELEIEWDENSESESGSNSSLSIT
jgi:amphi-Trp domain-containing protein